MTAQKLLNMIHAVDSDHGQMELDLINAMFWCYKRGHTFLSVDEHYMEYHARYAPHDEVCVVDVSSINCFDVTGSRDALKYRRPDGWYFMVFPGTFDDPGKFGVFSGMATMGADDVPFEAHELATEELAELSLIVQVMQEEETWM